MAAIEKGSIRGEAQPYVAAFAAKGVSRNQALAMLREMGLGYQRQQFLNDYRSYLGLEKAKDVGKYTRKDRYPGAASVVATPLKLSDRYQHLMEVRRVDPRTGQEIEPFQFWFGTDEPALQGVLEAMAWAELEKVPPEDRPESPWVIVDVTRLVTRYHEEEEE